jgi:hypothetical protein
VQLEILATPIPFDPSPLGVHDGGEFFAKVDVSQGRGCEGGPESFSECFDGGKARFGITTGLKEVCGHQKSTRKTIGIVLPILSVGDSSLGTARIHFEVAFEAEAQRALLSMKDKVAEFVSHGESALPRLSQPFRHGDDRLVTIACDAGGGAIERLLPYEGAQFPRDRFHIEVSRVAYRQVRNDLLGQLCCVRHLLRLRPAVFRPEEEEFREQTFQVALAGSAFEFVEVRSDGGSTLLGAILRC